MAEPEPGLCRTCRWTRIVESGRGSRFYLCGRSRSDPRFPRYPRLPVLRCAGFESLESASPEMTRRKDEQ